MQCESYLSGDEKLPLFAFITGKAGSGKTTFLKQLMEKDRAFGTLCATTGIAAVNLAGNGKQDVATINSTLGYFDTESLYDAKAHGKISRNLRQKVVGKRLVLDEISMMPAEQLDAIAEECEKTGKGLILTGDFCQLPPVDGKYAFEARCWERLFAPNTIKLDKVWRQDNPLFINAINAARQGDGDACIEQLLELEGDEEVGQIFHPGNIDSSFDGTTIMAVNRKVDEFNDTRLARLLEAGNRAITWDSFRWGRQRGEWKLIPQTLTIAENAYVQILANDSPYFTYANGDCGYLLDADNSTATIRLKRTDGEVTVSKICRKCTQKQLPEGCSEPPTYMNREEYAEWYEERYPGISGWKTAYNNYLDNLTVEHRKGSTQPYFDFKEAKWVVGEIFYMPLRLAYAVTVHKTQGLSLDTVQIDPTHYWMGQPAMVYVALSRCRSPKGLRIVGNAKALADKTNVALEVLEWV